MLEPAPRVTVTDPVTVTVDGKEITAQRGELVISACERHGTYIPRFCHHHRMNPVGMCRMCLVEIDIGRGAVLQPSCMIECAEGMKVDTRSDLVRKAQDGVLEFLLVNHPLDCPVCDKGGECPLQDQTMAFGPGESRFVEEKRHFPKPIAISETVYLDRERCILCDRCTRFADEVAGDPLIHFMDRGSATQVNTFPGQPFASYFSGNTVQICPVGALTAKPYRFKARPWDLEVAESTCTGCSVGCRITVQTSRNRVLRYLGVDSDPVNWSWLCDKGRFGFEAVGSEERLGEPLVRDGDELVAARWADALDRAATAVREGLERNGAGGFAVLGGSRLTNEAAYAWVKLAKGVVGSDHVDAQLGDGLPAGAVLGLPRATIDQACRPGGTVIWLGPDPREELGVLFIRLRHAVIRDGVTLIELVPQAGGLSGLAAASLRYQPGEVAALARALVAPAPGEAAGVPAADLARAAELLGRAEGPVTVVVGRASMAEAAGTIVDAAATLHEALPGARFLSALRRANVHGALDAGMSPGLLPGRVRRSDAAEWFGRHWPTVPAADGADAAGILEAAAAGRIDTLVLLGADPLADFPDRDLAERGLTGARTVIAVDQFLSGSSARAAVVLAAAGFAEVDGTTTNLEGRVSMVGRRVTPPGTARPDWLIASELARRLGADLGFDSVEAVRAEMQRCSPVHRGLTEELLGSTAAADGVVLPVADQPDGAPAVMRFEAPAPTEVPPLDAYSLRLVSGRALYDEGTLLAHCPSSAGLATGAVLRLNPTDHDRLGVAPGGRVRVSGGEGSLTLAAVADPGLPRGAASVTWGQSDADVGRLLDARAVVTEVRLEVAP